ncbi:DUF2971 domain-containing protein [Prevotella sp. Rep29]|uniref:DUF2971 domain-containing protein n=1 Tax=Prevotella sp. Rep29 TaxID=2691580 RepID=UPI001C6EE621|nr:DUF2971 domain-containing protein [Prevotella sp. Rep29]QYR10356.1 DUF2971 domain-containing protein [Prevotella sp. Rep29]
MATSKIKCPKCKTTFPLEPRRASLPTSLYHYTSFEVLTNLLKSDRETDGAYNLHFWFSNPLQTNDKREVHFFNEKLFETKKGKELEKQIDDIKNKVGNPFTLSFVHQKKSCSNEIPMWKMYGNNFKGVRLKFNFKKLQNLFQNKNGYDLILCEYLNKNQMDVITRNIRNFKDRELEDIYKKAVSYKMNEWSYENEWRIVFWTNEITKVEYRTNDGRLYMPIKIPLDCLDLIEIGPKADQDAIDGSLKLIKEKIGDVTENHFDILKSKLQIGYV